MEFLGKRVTHEYTQINFAAPETVFPLLCPVREAEWVPGWRYRLIYSESGVAEAGCVFVTNENGREMTWVVTEYDPVDFRIGFVWVSPGMMVVQIRIALATVAPLQTSARIRYTYTGLSVEGNREVERYGEDWFRNKMEGWEAAINYYLRTGAPMDAAGGE